MRHFACFVFGVLLAPAGPVLAEDPQATAEFALRLTGDRVNIRNADGERKCTLDRNNVPNITAIGRHPDGQRLKVRINAAGCPGEGFISANFVRNAASETAGAVTATVKPSELALRDKPDPDGAYQCGLGKGSKVQVLQDNPTGSRTPSWVKVKVLNPERGCPNEGFVNGNYLSTADEFAKLPLSEDLLAKDDDQTNTEGNFECLPGTNCNKDKALEPPKGTEDIAAVLEHVEPAPFAKDSWWQGVLDLVNGKKKKPPQLTMSRGLLKMKTEAGNVGACGSIHYNPEPNDRDIYAAPVTACAFTAFLQKWKKDHCPNNEDGCRIAWGDISHVTDPGFKGEHKTHTQGNCIDIRPLRKEGFENKPLCIFPLVRGWVRRGGKYVRGYVCPSSKNKKGTLVEAYGRERMTDLVSTLKEMGGTQIFFNDPKTGATPASGHANHLHVCFHDNAKVRETCENFVPDLNVCPEIQ